MASRAEALPKLAQRLWACPDLTPLERQTFRRHLLAAALDGLYAGLVSLTAYVMRKELAASAVSVAMLYSVQMTMFAFSSVGTPFITAANHRKVMVVAGLLGRLSYVWVVGFHSPASLVAIAAWVSLCHAVYLPAQNLIFRSNYRDCTRGACYARAQTLALVCSSGAAGTMGKFLAWRPHLFPWAYAVAALCGLGAYLTYATMPVGPQVQVAPRRRTLPFQDTVEILRHDPMFRRFELFFFLYGVTFMLTEPLFPLMLHDVLHADWQHASKVLGTIHPLVMIVCLPLYGRLMDKRGASLVAAVAYGLLALWPLTVAIRPSLAGAYLSYVWFGMGMAGVDVAWMLGPSSFAQAERVHSYMAVHVTLVGVRALAAPYAGLLLKEAVGFRAALLVSALLFLSASGLMFRLHGMWQASQGARRREVVGWGPHEPSGCRP